MNKEVFCLLKHERQTDEQNNVSAIEIFTEKFSCLS